MISNPATEGDASMAAKMAAAGFLDQNGGGYFRPKKIELDDWILDRESMHLWASEFGWLL